jgi:hypothetical protein
LKANKEAKTKEKNPTDCLAVHSEHGVLGAGAMHCDGEKKRKIEIERRGRGDECAARAQPRQHAV